MNPAKKQKFLMVMFILLGLGGTILSFYFYSTEGQTGYLLTAFFFLFMFGLFIWKFSKLEIPETYVEFKEGILAYLKYLEKELKITIPENYEIYDTVDDELSYKTVLMINDTRKGGKLYYPIEFYKKWAINNDGEPFVQFGKGQGRETKNIDVVKTFLIKNRDNKNQYMLDNFEALIDKKLQGGKAN